MNVVILLSRNLKFSLSLPMVAYVLKYLHILTYATLHNYTKVTARKHPKDVSLTDIHDLHNMKFWLMRIFILHINKLLIFNFLAILVPCSVLLIMLLNFLY